MTIKTLLAPITGDKADVRVLDTALAMAQFTGAHIHVLYLHRDPSEVVATPMGYGMSATMVEPLIDAAEKQAEKALHQACVTYEKWKTKNRIEEAITLAPSKRVTAEFTQAIGRPSERLSKAGRIADLICCLRPTDQVSVDWSGMVETALIETGKPILLAPTKKQMQPVKSIAIGWNGSQEAARAVSYAMPLLEVVEHVTVISCIGNDLSKLDVGAFTDSLRWHGINATAKILTPNNTNVSKRLQTAARKAEAQLIVIGGYSHSRLREFIFGGVTDDFMKDGDLPVLMAH